MARAGKPQREREALAEPMASEQAGIQQIPSESYRARVWELHLRGVPKTRIAAAVGIHRETVATIITRLNAEVRAEQRMSPARKLGEAVSRMRRIQEQAWDDHDADDERELRALFASDASSASEAETAETNTKLTKLTKNTKESPRSSNVTVRYQSQRSQYLRVILDAEKEIARLEGLYENLLESDAGVAVTFVKLEQGDLVTLSAARRPLLPAASPLADPATSSTDGEP